MSDFRDVLRDRFERQAAFATGYSPLYAQLFALIASWLAAPQGDAVTDWLVEAAMDRARAQGLLEWSAATGDERITLDVSLLLLAGLHRDVLAGLPGVGRLAAFYPTAGGRVPEPRTGELASAFRSAILARRDALAEFIRAGQVQTNETARGLCWLLPAALTGWPEVDLVELGASAGLNLIADRRSYRVRTAANDRDHSFKIGAGSPPQFVAEANGRLPARWPPLSLPRVGTRLGGDARPFSLDTAEDELTLASFVWADQPERLTRLREGFAARHAAENAGDHTTLVALDLPDGLVPFLLHELVSNDRPTVIFNTAVTLYLREQGSTLRTQMANWAARRSQPVLWLQWEPTYGDADELPIPGMFQWTADWWHADVHHHHWRLGWVHPHGTRVTCEDGLLAFIEHLGG